MSRRRKLSTKKKIALLVSAAAVAGGGAFTLATTSNAAQSPQKANTLSSAADSTVCQGLATALGNNQKFIDGQKASPDAQSQARIANREAVIAQINGGPGSGPLDLPTMELDGQAYVPVFSSEEQFREYVERAAPARAELASALGAERP
ncbi:hypothetical protein ABZX30_38115, partial [Streptomyces sp. NPDC004542]